ncbi:MAG: hypothetical protein LBL31_08575 [Spirochaetaceae bacterium]|nr:hypothetical protein [Spirochaetaceae bacterium]
MAAGNGRLPACREAVIAMVRVAKAEIIVCAMRIKACSMLKGTRFLLFGVTAVLLSLSLALAGDGLFCLREETARTCGRGGRLG